MSIRKKFATAAGRRRYLAAALAGTMLGLAGTTAVPASAVSGETIGYAVFDRTTNTFTAQSNATMRFRSASVVKLLIALDYLWNRGTPAEADRAALDAMLRSSADGPADDFWVRGGSASIIHRMKKELELQNTEPPPPPHQGWWGYTATSPADTVRIYRYVLDRAPATTRDYLMSRLRQSTRCATDQFDQSFGIRSAFTSPSAVKQGWSGFGRRGDCDGEPADPATSAPGFDIPGLDLTSRALHSTGTVGAGDRSIVAVFTLQPVGTSFGAASSRITAVTRGLTVPGATPVSGAWFSTWGTRVRVRETPSLSARTVGWLPAGIEVAVRCQKTGELVNAEGYRNEWWAYLPERGGYMTNIYVRSPGNKLPGVLDCS
jgi:hypothetical protein